MKNSIASTICAAVLGLSLASGVSAQEQSNKTGAYAFADLGMNVLGGTFLDLTQGSQEISGDANFKASFAGGAGGGYRFSNNFAMEAAYHYRRAELDNVELGGSSFDDGDFANTQLSVSALYFLDLFGSPRAETYLGVGVAWIQEVDIDLASAGGEREFESDEFGFEVLAGVRYYFGERGFVDAGARYTAAGRVTLDAPGDSGDVIKADYDPLLLGVRVGWRF